MFDYLIVGADVTVPSDILCKAQRFIMINPR